MFPPGEPSQWLAQIVKEIDADRLGGKPRPFYVRSDVEEWESLSPLPIQAGWSLVAERFVPEEVAVWLYDERFLEEGKGADAWLIPSGVSVEAPSKQVLYRLCSIGDDERRQGQPVWELPLTLTDDLQLHGQEALQALPLEKATHLALRLDQRLFLGAILLRAVRLAWLPHPVQLWALPVEGLYRSTGKLPEEGIEENLVRATLYALGALMGGAQFLYVPPISDAVDSHAARWSRNISHLLRYEVGYLNTEPDPLAGSFYIETEARRLARELRAILRW
jgi:hypothetical protein